MGGLEALADITPAVAEGRWRVGPIGLLREDASSMLLPVALIALAAALAFIVVAYVRGWHWTGFTKHRAAGRAGEPRGEGKTLWDWMQLLIVPLVLAGAAFALNQEQTRRDERRENARAKQERKIAADARQEDALRIYLSQMSDLILHQKLRSANPKDCGAGSQGWRCAA